jgi:hypothetical protein
MELLAGACNLLQQQLGESSDNYQARVAEFQRQYQSNLAGTTGPSLPAGANNPFYPAYAANGGRIGFYWCIRSCFGSSSTSRRTINAYFRRGEKVLAECFVILLQITLKYLDR